MKRVFIGLFFFNIILFIYAQTPSGVYSLRNYVGLISVADHPDLIAFVDKIKEELVKDKKPDEIERQRKNVPKEAPYERPAGSGFLFRADNGNTYVLTNWHVIAHSWTYSITFERSIDQKTIYSGLTLVAADEERDLALLAFPSGNNPGIEGLRLLERPVQEGEEVYSAGFPALGRDPVWQLGRGQISNSRVMLHKYYDDEEDETMEGPFIQHTSQVDPGNSGGPLLIPDISASSGFSIAGINARSAKIRQAANYSIPNDTIREFLERAINHPEQETEADRENLDARLLVFLRWVKTNRYSIFDWITYQCFLNNAEYAFYQASMKYNYDKDFPNYLMGSLASAFIVLVRENIPYSNVDKNEEVSVKAVEKNGNTYTVVFYIQGKTISSQWVKEHGAWRIASIGKINGDKSKIAKVEKLYYNQRNVRDGYTHELNYIAEGGYTQVLNRGVAVYGAIGVSIAGIRCIFADTDYWQLELFGRGYFKPLRFNIYALEPHLGLGMGVKYLPKTGENDSGLRFGISPQLGVQFTSSAIPGIYIGAAYQYNLFFRNSNDKNNTLHLFIFLAGYRLK